jgi:hypothetical protein
MGGLRGAVGGGATGSGGGGLRWATRRQGEGGGGRIEWGGGTGRRRPSGAAGLKFSSRAKIEPNTGSLGRPYPTPTSAS